MTQKTRALDLFSGPRGWDVYDAELGIESDGVEDDPAARATAEAAGFKHAHDDVTTYRLPQGHGYTGLKASPPCQTFSAAGNGDGRRALSLVISELAFLASGGKLDYTKFADKRTGLVLEPFRVIQEAWLMGRAFEWIALEQVPAVLPVWEAYARHLGPLGYSVAVGNVSSEQYGVPQTRKRAVLLAYRSRSVQVHLPEPTHSRFHSRSPERLDPGVLKWVSMADALRYGLAARPAPTVTGGGTYTGGAEPIAHLSRWTEREDWVQRSNYSRGSSGGGTAEERGRTERTADQPSTTVTGKGFQWKLGDVRSSHGTIRDADQPAPTLTASMDNGNFQKVYRNGNQANSAKRELDNPAPTVHFGARSNKVEWMEPEAADEPSASGVRVTVEEAALLQTFPPGYPWQGSKTQQYQQVGNAIPPLLAKALLEMVI